MSEPPDYVEPESKAPGLRHFDARPLVSQIQVVERGITELQIRVPLERTSAVPLRWHLWRNFDLEGMTFLLQRTLEESASEIVIDYKVPLGFPTGCHQISLLVSDEDNLNYTGPDDEQPLQIGDRETVALVSWWLNVDPAPGEEANLVDCPSRISTP